MSLVHSFSIGLLGLLDLLCWGEPEEVDEENTFLLQLSASVGVLRDEGGGLPVGVLDGLLGGVLLDFLTITLDQSVGLRVIPISSSVWPIL